MKTKTDILAFWVDHQLHVLNEYGFNVYDIHFYSDKEAEQDPDLKGGVEGFESGLFGDNLSLRVDFQDFHEMSDL